MLLLFFHYWSVSFEKRARIQIGMRLVAERKRTKQNYSTETQIQHRIVYMRVRVIRFCMRLRCIDSVAVDIIQHGIIIEYSRFMVKVLIANSVY